MNNTHVKIIVISGIVITFAGLVGAFFLTHERKKKEVRVPPSGEARKNPYLALERLLTRHEIPTDTTATQGKPAADKTLIFLADRDISLTPDQRKRWVAWVESGGHLALVTPPRKQRASPLLEALGYSYTDPDDGEITHTAPDERTYDGPSDTAPVRPQSIPWESAAVDWVAEGRFEVDESADLDLDGEVQGDAADAGRADTGKTDAGSTEPSDPETDGDEETDGDSSEFETRVLAVSKNYGDGRITLVHSMSIFHNSSIGNGERATLAVDIASLADRDSVERKGLVVRFSARRSWTWYVLSTTWPMFAAGLVLVLLALWQGRYRFGPVLPPPPEERRSRAEHIRAMGEFLWDRDQATALLRATREALFDELERKYPSLARLSGRERRLRVREILDLGDEEADLIFRNPHNLSPDQFRTRIRLMERYRRNL